MRGLKGERERAARPDGVSAELIELCKAGDERAWTELVEATHREVYTLCLRILRDPHDAAEATQDAFFKAWRGLKGYRGDALFTTWLYRVAANAALSKRRKVKHSRMHESAPDDDAVGRIAAPGSLEAIAAARLDVEALERALDSLPEHYRSAVVLRDVYGLSIEEMASELGISETAAKVRVHRARKRLRAMLFPPEAASG